MNGAMTLLDWGRDDADRPVLLDGTGRVLPQGADPVYLTFAEGELQRNSAGVAFKPQANPSTEPVALE